jgi:hypothetical protein
MELVAKPPLFDRRLSTRLPLSQCLPQEEACRFTSVFTENDKQVRCGREQKAAGAISSVRYKSYPPKTRIFPHTAFIFVRRKGVEKTEGDVQISRPVNLNCYLPRCCPLVASDHQCADALTSRYRGGVSSAELN